MSFYGPTSSSKLQRSGSQNDARIAGLYGSFSTFDLKFHYYTLINFTITLAKIFLDLEHTIGKGHFAIVKLARHVFTGEKVYFIRYICIYILI